MDVINIIAALVVISFLLGAGYFVIVEVKWYKKDHKTTAEHIAELEAKKEEWKSFTAEKRATIRTNDVWVKEQIPRDLYTEYYNDFLKEERLKTSDDSMPFHKELAKWVAYRDRELV